MDSNQPVYIGDLVAGDYFTGRLDEIRIYNRVLTASEVLAIYNAGV